RQSRRLAVLRAAPFVIGLILAVFGLVDLALSRSDDVRRLPKSVWFLVVLVPVAGPVAWFLWGRPQQAAESESTPERPLAPDDDPEFLGTIERQRQAREREKLRDWQADLERRERELRERELRREQGQGPRDRREAEDHTRRDSDPEG
ncbi:MAG TPA: PLD nuclease N-terminal domain-containing protein, partial [Actinopolymorphaceae bacterium]